MIVINYVDGCKVGLLESNIDTIEVLGDTCTVHTTGRFKYHSFCTKTGNREVTEAHFNELIGILVAL